MLSGAPGTSGRLPSSRMIRSGAAPPAIGAMPIGRSRSASRFSARGLNPDAASGVTIGVIPPIAPPETGIGSEDVPVSGSVARQALRSRGET